MVEGNGEVRELPKGWDWVKLGDVCQEIETKKPELEPEWEFQYIDIASIDNVIKKIASPKTYLGKDSPSRARQVVRTNDIVFSTVRTYLMNIAMVPEILDDQIASTGFCVIRAADKIIPKYIFYFSISHGFINQLNELQRGTSYPAVRDRDIFAQPFPLCSTKEQERIVEKIEELFSDVDQGVESLKMAQKQLKVYRQAVLKWAFEGKLTEAWRSQQPTLKTGEALLAQIKAERENRYQKRLAEWEEKVREWGAIGKAGKKPTKPQTPKEPSSLTKAELVELPKLPEGWCWAKVGLILLIPPSNGHSVKDRKGGFKVLRLTAIRNGLIDIRKSKEGDWDEEDAHPYIVQPGDFLLARGNGSINLVGAGGLVSEKSDVAYPDTMIKLIIDKSIFISKLFALLWNSAYFRKQIEKSVRTTAGIYKINQNHINNFLVPLTPINEQGQIAEEIESRLSICDQLEATIIENLQKAEALRQSILKQAFEGKLVPQDPNDEPAEKLLERIRAERQEKESQKTSKPLR